MQFIVQYTNAFLKYTMAIRLLGIRTLLSFGIPSDTHLMAE